MSNFWSCDHEKPSFKFCFALFFISVLLTFFIIFRYVSFMRKTQEGSCIISGIAYDLRTRTFDKCCNIRPFKFETSSTFGGLIQAFNVTTNRWAMRYVFKRLRFLNSKPISHILTLLYLALWHGLWSGYYIAFTLEFLVVKVEKEVGVLVVVNDFLCILDNCFALYVALYVKVRFSRSLMHR